MDFKNRPQRKLGEPKHERHNKTKTRKAEKLDKCRIGKPPVDVKRDKNVDKKDTENQAKEDKKIAVLFFVEQRKWSIGKRKFHSG
jgi:hypothetical protein